MQQPGGGDGHNGGSGPWQGGAPPSNGPAVPGSAPAGTATLQEFGPPLTQQGYPPQGYPPPAHQQGYPPPAHQQGYPPPAHQQGYPPPAQQQGYPPPQQQGYPPPQQQGYPPPQQGYPQQQQQNWGQPQGYPQQQAWGQQPQHGYPQQQGWGGYQQGAYPGQAPGQAPAVQPVSTALYVAALWLGLGLGAALTAWGLTDSKVTELLGFSWIPLLIGGIFFLVLIYKGWAALQDGGARTTPGAAVGYLFIPIFSIYWIFIAIGQWGKEYNAFCQRQGIRGHVASEGLFIAHCVMSFIPFASFLTPITGTMVVLQICRGINTIANRHRPHIPQATAYPHP